MHTGQVVGFEGSGGGHSSEDSAEREHCEDQDDEGLFDALFHEGCYPLDLRGGDPLRREPSGCETGPR